MMVDLEDVILLLEEVENTTTKAALALAETPHEQSWKVGRVAGVKACLSKLENHYGREGNIYPQS